jgi:hypothetical protein
MMQGAQLELRRSDGTSLQTVLVTYGVSVWRGEDGALYTHDAGVYPRLICHGRRPAHVRHSDFVIVSSFGLRNSYVLSSGLLLALTYYVKSGTLYSIKAQWACLTVPACRILFGDSERSGDTRKEARQPDAVRLQSKFAFIRA